MVEPKKGDVIWLKGWGGIIGKFVYYDGETMVLEWPDPELGFGGKKQQMFSTVKEGDFEILSAEEVFIKMGLIFKNWREAAAVSITDAAEKMKKTVFQR